ncbi:probable L-gulonolactone oxidase 6 [Spinacia oleracea]|uniref:L-gulonolactone oxidase n=1 Tax=Spinacia oleracea TaxID=3562 RepID=A0ABM3RDM9_SPIOL|nr:probable L-gulonolactone oxidase 6 [Spinacia oleracea]
MMPFSHCKKSCTSKTKVFVSSFVLLLYIGGCSPPEDPIKCSTENSDCTITNGYGIFPDRATCRVAEAVYPTSEEELVAVVATATMNNRKMKVTTRYSHSFPKLVCPDGEDGILISTKNLNNIHNVDTTARTMTVDSGVTLRQLINEAAKVELALPYSPYWWGITIGGMLSTGAHGSSLWGKGSAIHDYVVELRIITPGSPEDGYAKTRTLRLRLVGLDFNAAKVSLGVYGVISQVTLKLEPMFKRSITYMKKADSELGDEALIFGDEHEFADLLWYPSQKEVVYRIDDRVPLNTQGDGLYDFTAFRPTLSVTLAVLRSLEENQEARGDAEGKCITSKLTTTALWTNAFGLTNNGIIFTGYPVVGFQNRLQSSGSCLDNDALIITACPWDSRLKGEFYYKTAFTIGMSKVKAFIQDVQNLVSLQPESFCGIEQYNGILMRYVKASTAYLGKEEDGIDFDITYYRSKDPLTPRLFEDIYEEVEQMGMFKYGGLPHWGKNRNLAFESVIQKYKNGEEFVRVKEKFDLQGLFSSEWTNQVFGLKDGLSIVKDGCALEGLCICSEDSHCAPNKGYFCRPGRIYKEARVCTGS